jgi:hypothetical protein
MVRDVSAPVRLVERDAGPAENVSGCKQVFPVSAPAESNDVGMLNKQQLVRYFSLLSPFDQSPLQLERFGIADTPEVTHLTITH